MFDINDMIRENLGTSETSVEDVEDTKTLLDNEEILIEEPEFESEDTEDYIRTNDIRTPITDAEINDLLADPDSEVSDSENNKIGEDIEIDNSVYVEGYIDEEKTKKNKKINILLWILTLLTAALTALAIKTIFIATIYVPTSSMEPSIQKGEIVIGDSLDVLDMNIQRGDIVIFRYPKQIYKKYIKRVIGLPGDRVVIVQNRIYINDEVYPLEEPYVKDGTWTKETISPKDVKVYNVPAGEYFVLGDNRNNSEDSRYWGYLPGSYINAKGRYVIHSIYPFSAEKLY